MKITLSKRGMIRLVSFALATVAVLSAFCIINAAKASRAETKLEYQYLRSVDDLGNYLEDIETTLTKTMYSNSAETMTALSNKLSSEASFAKECLSGLPMNYLNLENTYKFLSQVGDYSVALAKKVARGDQLTGEERENMEKLKGYCTGMLEQVFVLQDAIRTGSISFNEVKNDTSSSTTTVNSVNISDGFSEFEDSLSSYPTLIYDGPFSDHILEKTPVMTKGKAEISREQAREIAAKAAGLKKDKLSDDEDETSKMPSYCFKGDDINIAVTKNGGYVAYYINYKIPEQQILSAKECIAKAKEYLKALGIDSMTETYYEINSNMIVINFAAIEQGIICYPDLIKVAVSMENGEVLRYDARGYITNHTERESFTTTLTSEQAAAKVSPILTVKSCKLCVIPTDSLSEVLCYECICSYKDDDILVYINAATGNEENLYILYTDDNGTLTV